MENIKKGIIQVISLSNDLTPSAVEELIGLKNPKSNIHEQPPLLNIDLDYFIATNNDKKIFDSLPPKSKKFGKIFDISSYCIKTREDSITLNNAIQSLIRNDLSVINQLIPLWCKGMNAASKLFEEFQIEIQDKPHLIHIFKSVKEPHFIPNEQQLQVMQQLVITNILFD